MAILVKVIRVPGTVTEIGLNEGATVADALRTVNVTPSNSESVTLNGVPATMDTLVCDGSRIILAKAAKSNTD